jgi:tight adherence protein B
MMTLILAIIMAAAIALFVWGAVGLVTTGWVSYERKYLAEAEETLDSMFVTIPTRQLLYISVGGAVFSGVLSFVVIWSIIISAAVGVFFLLLPWRIIKFLKKKRNGKFTEQMVDALFSMSNSLRSGYSMPQAIGLISREMQNPVKQEFKLVAQEMQLGTPLEDAMQHLHERMPSQEMELVVAAMAIARNVGGNLSEILQNIANTIRERLRVEGRVKALTAQGKLQGIVMCAMPFFLAFVLYLVAPSFIKPVFQEWAGYLILAVIIVMEALGIFVISRVVKIDI